MTRKQQQQCAGSPCTSYGWPVPLAPITPPCIYCLQMILCLVSIILAFLYMAIIMFSRIQRKTFLFITFTFAIIGVIFVFKYFTTPLAASPSPISLRQEDNTVFAPDVDMPFNEPPTERVWGLGVWNTIFCYPSVGGFIVNEHITSVELDFLNLSRFEKTPRSSDPNEEDMFCRQLRRTGARWWDSYYSWDLAVVQKSAPMSAKEREALVLGWPEKGGVWVIREHNWGSLGSRGWAWTNAHTMEERCKALEMLGAVYYANPEDCEPVKALLEGFGEHEREPEENYCHDRPADYFRELWSLNQATDQSDLSPVSALIPARFVILVSCEL